MKTADKAARQGEAFFFKVSEIAEGSKEVSPNNGEHIVSHSETGHHHTVSAEGIRMLEHPSDPNVCYLVMDSVEHIDIEHLRSFDTHETLRLLGSPGDVWQRNIQQEWSPDGWRQVAD